MCTRIHLGGLACLIIGQAMALAQQPAGVSANVEFKTQQERLSYAIGCQIGTNLKAQQTEYDIAMLVKGLTDVLKGQTPVLSELEIRQLITQWQQQVQAAQLKQRQELAEKNLAEGKAFLAANAKKEGVKVLPSGLQYKVIKEGSGKSPTMADRVKVHYRGRFINGTQFDSSYDRGQPAEFPVGAVIKGWTEALQLMKPGSHYEIYIPPDLAYGPDGNRAIPPNAVLIFDVELLEVTKAEPNPNPAQ
ncbi:MAG: FKBP-type peptidyl-prolyl cis-trans isomerase [Sedimentisphaerales bacterium]|jgi:FKBP-type peptidyl-prolyl cis-trans isomerase FklB|nr:FKBP-type peptidyl-prolyl cis-trans isomerase [Sedimentisphaerales bacterium]